MMVDLVLVEPWVDVPTARCFLRWLTVADQSGKTSGLTCFSDPPAVDALANWLVRQGLGALAYGHTLAYGCCRETDLPLRRSLQADMFSAAAESSMKQARLQAILHAFAEAQVPLVLLKGAALSLTVYDDPAERTMSDIDIWVQDDDMAAAAKVMGNLGYGTNLKGERPFALQQLSGGEIKFGQTGIQTSLVELHWSAFPGWWLTRTAAVDEDGLWARREPLTEGSGVSQLEPADMVIQLGVHTAINHQFGLSALRSMVDIALTADKRDVDWRLVAKRAREWRVRTAVYTVLTLLDQLIGVDGIENALKTLEPSALRLRLIHRFVTPESVLAGQDLRSGWRRFLLLLLLVDRKRDMVKLVYRTLWPEPIWLEARYGDDVGHWKHLWRVVRYREL